MGEAGTSRPSPAQWFDALYALTLETNSLLPPSLRRLTETMSRLARLSPPQSLTVATTVRSTRFRHTHPASFVVALVVNCSQGSAQSSARPAVTSRARRHPRPPHPAPRFMTTRDPPLLSGGINHNYRNSELYKEEYFCGYGLTNNLAIRPTGGGTGGRCSLFLCSQ